VVTGLPHRPVCTLVRAAASCQDVSPILPTCRMKALDCQARRHSAWIIDRSRLLNSPFLRSPQDVFGRYVSRNRALGVRYYQAVTLNWLNDLALVFVPRLKYRAELRAAWGRLRDPDDWLASRAFDLSRSESTVTWVDDRTWRDLEFPRIFSVLNTTVTPIGRQYLYKQLRKYEYDAEILRQRTHGYEVLRANNSLRESLQWSLKPLKTDSTAYIADALLGPLPEKPKYHLLICAWGLFSLLALISTLALSLPLWIVGAVLGINAIVLFTSSPKMVRDAQTLITCSSMLAVADNLAALNRDEGIAPLSELAKELPNRAELRRDVRALTLLAGNPALAGFALLLDLCCLVKLVAYIRTVDKFTQRRSAWLSTYELIGSIDAMIAIASFLQRTPRYCRPSVSLTSRISLTGGYHPLLQHPVLHSVTLDNRSALVTGSNMAGKTTFIKMIGTNIVLGHTLGICLADSATIPKSGVMASIRGEQSVETGESRFFSEVKAIRQFIDSASRSECGVFVIDEIFSGTNTIERVAAAKAVLSAISKHAQVLATTHDVELQHLLATTFELFHFQENPAVEGFFDFELRPGISTQRNAIRVLERMGMPEDIIGEALALVAEQSLKQ
jgi:MutS domain V